MGTTSGLPRRGGASASRGRVHRRDARRDQRIIDLQPFAAAIARRIHAASFSHVAVEDLIQDAYLGLIEGVDTWDPENEAGVKERVWCYFKIRQAVYDAHRRKHYRTETAESIEEDTRYETPDLEEQLVASSRRETIEHAYALLTDREQIALRTRENGLKLKDAAKQLRITESAVCVLRKEAAEHFKELLLLAGVEL